MDMASGGRVLYCLSFRTRIAKVPQTAAERCCMSVSDKKQKEISRQERKLAKLQKYLGGVHEMDKLPGAIFVIDVKRIVDVMGLVMAGGEPVAAGV